MDTRTFKPQGALAVIGFILLFFFALAYARALQSEDQSFFSVSRGGSSTQLSPTEDALAARWGLPTLRPPGAPILTPTPDVPHPIPSLRKDAEFYRVQAGDTLVIIANRYGVSVDLIAQENDLANPNLLSVGQILTIPAPTPQGISPDFKIIPDSELVYGPSSLFLNLEEFIEKQGGYLKNYKEDVEGVTLSGAKIVLKVAQDFSVHPRILLALLEYQSNWVTKTTPKKGSQEYPLGLVDSQRKGLYRQLTWAANSLNRGFYLWRVNGIATWSLRDDSLIQVAPTINAGTAAVQQFFATLYSRTSWERAVSEQGLFATYNALFGYPFDYAIEPSLPPDLVQPPMQLPFETGTTWAFTGGPHGAWGDGAAWAALDFAPPGDAVGCVPSDDWVVAVADGLILRAENGAVIQDLDGDGFEQTGWVVLYMHIETRDRVPPGTFLKAGERIGHPSCEGGFSTGTHVHLARRYNGEWIPADQDIPFILDGWVSYGSGTEYDGTMRRDGQMIEAYAGRSPNNGIHR